MSFIRDIVWRFFCSWVGTLCRTKMKMLYDDLFTGARQEMENMSELLYVSVENQALSHLPYIIALDHRSK